MRQEARADERTWKRTRDKWLRIGAKQGNKLTCGLCNLVIDLTIPWPDPKSLEIDHIIPWDISHDNSFENSKPSHKLCNGRKGKDITLSRVIIRNPRWGK